MKVILVNGSPHKDGCTNIALEEIIKVLKNNNIETELIWIGNEKISGCIGCNYCMKNNNQCFMNEDTVNIFINKVKDADGFVFGSPVHFAAPSGIIKPFMDRVFYGRGKLFAGKAFASVVSCRRGGASSAFDDLNKYALMSNMFVVGSSYWNQIHGTNKQEAQQDLEGLQTMRNVGENMSYLLKCLHFGNQNGISRNNYEQPIKTNFI